MPAAFAWLLARLERNIWMFDVNSFYWNLIWMFFVVLDGFIFVLGVKLLIKRNRMVKNGREE